MNRSKFTVEQIPFALQQGDAGQPRADVCRQMGASEATSYIWRKRYANLGLLEGRELAAARPRIEYERIHIPLTREGWRVGRKRVHRLCRLEGLQLCMRVRRSRRISLHRGAAPAATGGGQYWAMESVRDQLADGGSSAC